MTDLTEADLAEAKALSDAATEGPWDFATAPNPESNETKAEYMARALTDAGPLYALFVPATVGQPGGYLVPAVTGDGPNAGNNAAFIAFARDFVPKAAAMLERSSAVPRVVATAAELDALPVGSVVLDGDGDAWQRVFASGARPWAMVGQVEKESAETVIGQTAPITVVHDPSAPAREDGEVETALASVMAERDAYEADADHLRGRLDASDRRNADNLAQWREALVERDAARAEVAALRAGIDSLAAEWEDRAAIDPYDSTSTELAAASLRALLAAHPAPVDAPPTLVMQALDEAAAAIRAEWTAPLAQEIAHALELRAARMDPTFGDGGED